MASTTSWSEYNNVAGVLTETAARTDANFKSVDDSTTSQAAAPVVAGTDSMFKVQSLKYTGTWTSLSALSYFISVAAGTGWIIKALVTATPGLPSSSPMSGTGIGGSAIVTMPTAAGTLNGDFGSATTGLSSAGGSGWTAAAPVYATALKTQLQTTSAAASGAIGGTPLVLTASWTES